jgi:hypothetical protein
MLQESLAGGPVERIVATEKALEVAMGRAIQAGMVLSRIVGETATVRNQEAAVKTLVTPAETAPAAMPVMTGGLTTVEGSPMMTTMTVVLYQSFPLLPFHHQYSLRWRWRLPVMPFPRLETSSATSIP